MGLAIALVVVAVVAVGVQVGVRLFFNVLSPFVDSRRRAKDDNYFFNGCRAGMMSRYRWISRHLPAAPRCKLCLVPFGIGAPTSHTDPLPVGVGLTFGVARVGNVGAGEVKDFTAVGDVVNTAARLQASASPGEILMSAEVHERVAERYPGAVRRTLTLRGKSTPVPAYSIAVASGAPVRMGEP